MSRRTLIAAFGFILLGTCSTLTDAQEKDKYDRLKAMEVEIKAAGFAAVKNVPELNEFDADGQTPLMIAAAAGQVEMIKSFLIAGAKANLVNSRGDTPLMSAVQGGHYHTSAQLLRAPSTDLYQRNKLGANVLHQAIASGPGPLSVIVDAILNTDLERRLRPDANDLLNDERKEGTLLVDTRLKGRSTMTGLMMASQNGAAAMVRLLIEHKAQVDLQNSTGETALMYASVTGNDDIVGLLLAAGARMDVVTHDEGFTALMLACSRGHLSVVDRLIAHALETNQYHVLDIRDFVGQTALEHALDSGEQLVIDRLVVAGADLGRMGAPHATSEMLSQRDINLQQRMRGDSADTQDTRILKTLASD